MKNYVVRLVWVVIPLVLFGIIGMQESFADVCLSTEYAFSYAEEDVVIVTITSSDEIIYDPPKIGFNGYISGAITSNFTINEIIYGNKEFPLKSGIVGASTNSGILKIGDRYVIGYTQYDDKWGFGFSCPTLEPISFTEFTVFYEDLIKNSCDVDKHYLIKNSNKEKVCVSHDIRDKLIKRGYLASSNTLSNDLP